MRGRMRWFNEAREAGVIEAEDGANYTVEGEDFVLGKGPKGRCAGLVVDFVPGEDGRAQQVSFPEDDVPRRARSRRSSRASL